MPKARNIPRRRLLFPIVPVWGDVFRVESSAAEVKERIEAIVRHLAGIQEREAWRNIQRASAGNSPADRDVVVCSAGIRPAPPPSLWYATCLLADLRTFAKNGTGSPMTTTAPPIIICPVCGAYGSRLHHDIRSSLVYSCLNCTHEWQLDPLIETTADGPTLVERRRTPSRAQQPRRPIGGKRW
jgi:hypothetical protein